MNVRIHIHIYDERFRIRIHTHTNTHPHNTHMRTHVHTHVHMHSQKHKHMHVIGTRICMCFQWGGWKEPETGSGGRGESEAGGRVGIERASAHGASACTHVYVGHVPAPTHASHPNPCKPCKPTGLSVHALHALTPHRPCVTPALPACLPCPLFTQTMRFEKQHRRSRSLCHSLESRSTAWGRRPPHNSHCTLPS